jgi:hypothetical protein
MKRNLTRIAIALIVATFTFSACKKSESGIKPTNTPKPNPDAVAKQIALSLYNSLSGKMGGTSINNGIKAPANLIRHNGRSLDAVSSLCGFTLDTAYSGLTTNGDTSTWSSTKLIFTNTCTTSNVDGYAVYDSVKTEVSTASFVNSYQNIQKYNVVALDNTFKLVSCNGSINTTIWNTLYTNTSTTGTYHALGCNYNLQGLVIDFSSGTANITKGTAPYTSYTKDIDSTTGAEGVTINYTGTIEFLGNYKAKLTIDPNHYYTIDYQTNTITPL